MSNSSTSSSELAKFCRSLAGFAAVLVVLYMASILVLSNLPVKKKAAVRFLLELPLMDRFSESHVRFAEARGQRDLDILFMGSSHVYRSFDPRIFEGAGYKTYNLGSTSQSPLISYFLYREFAPAMKPKLFVYEGFFRVLESEDGFESLRDIVGNVPMSKNIFDMIIASGSMRTFNWVMADQASRLTAPWAKRKEAKIFDKNFTREKYIPGGYVESERVYTPGETQALAAYKIRISKKQVRYLEKLLREAKAAGATPLVVVQPLPSSYMQGVVNYDEALAEIRGVAARVGAEFIDFNGKVELDDKTDFVDDHHLNASGVKKFNAVFLETPAVRRLKGGS